MRKTLIIFSQKVIKPKREFHLPHIFHIKCHHPLAGQQSTTLPQAITIKAESTIIKKNRFYENLLGTKFINFLASLETFVDGLGK
ncbi:Polyprotein P1234 [Frankliniella fusca]|uniref:Polyprotein P1234 n=1 Tax=Frankliniella fusca TaxID=407009 RepID=A0AAE1LHC7_9NEOP|nr:Polyprotein P1234 [Frankliniella fusca]